MPKKLFARGLQIDDNTSDPKKQGYAGVAWVEEDEKTHEKVLKIALVPAFNKGDGLEEERKKQEAIEDTNRSRLGTDRARDTACRVSHYQQAVQM